MNGTTYLTGYDGFLGMQVSLNHCSGGNQYLRSHSNCPFDPALDPYDPICLKVTDNCHVAGNYRKGYLIGFSALEFVALVVSGGAGEEAH
jgi:hypothetical protein